MKRTFTFLIRLLISGGVLALIASKLDWKKLSHVVQGMDLRWFFFSILIWGGVPLLASVRWRLLLSSQSIHLSYRKVLDLFFVGHFFNAFLLGTTGGDLVKIFYASQAAPDKKSAVTLTILIDRIIGLIAILIMALILIPLQWRFLTQTPETKAAALAVTAVILGGIAGITGLLFLPILEKNSFLKNLIDRLPFETQRRQIFESYVVFTKSWKTNIQTLLISFVIHILLFTSALAVLRSLGIEVDFLPFVSTLPIIGVLMAVPISISGFGVREGLFVIYLGLGPLWIDKEHAITFSLLYFCVNLCWSVIGGFFYLGYRHPELKS
ncbi:MAG: lysylphosphatidylglycerol synthase transmembrane domain-containing protein [Verrucomicrobiota bacterium]